MIRLRRVIPDAIDQKEVIRTALAQKVLRDWDEIVGKTLASKSHPDRVERGVVWISVQGSAWAQELRMMRETILDRLRQRGGDDSLFVDLRFGVRPLPVKVADKLGEEVASADLSELSIREIAERRLQRWKDDGTSETPS